MKYILPSNAAELRTILSDRPDIPTHPSQHQHHVTPVAAPLYVVTAISNPNRYYTRYKLYHAFEKMVADGGAVLYTVELALRNRNHEITRPDNPRHIQLRSPAQLWHKENLLNIAIHRLPADWEYVAWIDADVLFARPDWVVETVHQLQHYHVVQMFSHAFDLGPEFEPLGRFEGFMWSYCTGATRPVLVGSKRHKHGEDCEDYGGNSGYYGPGPTIGSHLWHPGYAWAARRSAVSDLGGLGDIGILGSGDHHMATALVGRVEDSIHRRMSAAYKKYWLTWQERAEEYIRRNVGYVPGTLLHYWHGKKKQRKYMDRWKILIENKFDPGLDLKRDPQDLWQLTERNTRLRDQIREYFRQRNEDSIDT